MPSLGLWIEENGMGLVEFVEEIFLDFGLSDEPRDDLRLSQIERLVTIWPMVESLGHEAGFMERFRVSE
jgi:hypothetical protein